jgi:hypothetical protein
MRESRAEDVMERKTQTRKPYIPDYAIEEICTQEDLDTYVAQAVAAERERLTTELDYLKSIIEKRNRVRVTVHDVCLHEMEQREKAEAERDALRSALQQIAGYGQDGICPYGCDAPNVAAVALRRE